MNFILENWGELLIGLMAFIKIVVNLTPTEKDNAVFSKLDNSKNIFKISMEWYYDISNWDNLCKYLSFNNKLKKPKLKFFSSKKWNKIGEDLQQTIYNTEEI